MLPVRLETTLASAEQPQNDGDSRPWLRGVWLFGRVSLVLLAIATLDNPFAAVDRLRRVAEAG